MLSLVKSPLKTLSIVRAQSLAYYVLLQLHHKLNNLAFCFSLFGIDIAQFPRIQKVCENLREVEAFQKADPANQPDFMLKWSN